MDTTPSTTEQPIFEQIKQTDTNGREYWRARELSKALGYREYRNFQPVIQKAKKACKNSEQQIHNHFVELHEMISAGATGEKEVPSIKLSRYACYLIVQNAALSKDTIDLQTLSLLSLFSEEKNLFLA